MLDTNGWWPNFPIAGKIVTRAQLLAEGFTEGEIAEREAELKYDIDRGLISKNDPEAALEVERQLRDPQQDMHVVVFDGQHRSANR